MGNALLELSLPVSHKRHSALLELYEKAAEVPASLHRRTVNGLPRLLASLLDQMWDLRHQLRTHSYPLVQ